MIRMRSGCRRCGLTRWRSCRRRSQRSTLKRAEGGLPAVALVIEGLHAFPLGPGLESLADVENAVHASGVPGGGELLEGLLGVGAGSFGVCWAASTAGTSPR